MGSGRGSARPASLPQRRKLGLGGATGGFVDVHSADERGAFVPADDDGAAVEQDGDAVEAFRHGGDRSSLLRQPEHPAINLGCFFGSFEPPQPRFLIPEQDRVAAQDVLAGSSVQRLVDHTAKHRDVAAKFLDGIRRHVHGVVVFRRWSSRRNAFGEPSA